MPFALLHLLCLVVRIFVMFRRAGVCVDIHWRDVFELMPYVLLCVVMCDARRCCALLWD